MLDNLRPDYSNTTSTFQRAATDPQGIAVAISQTRQSIRNPSSTLGSGSATASGAQAFNRPIPSESIDTSGYAPQGMSYEQMLALAMKNSTEANISPPSHPTGILHPNTSDTSASSLSQDQSSKETVSFQTAVLDRQEKLNIHASQTLSIMTKYNNKRLHNDKDLSALTTPEKKERGRAIRFKKMLREEKNKPIDELSSRMEELVASGERPLSQGPLENAPETLLVRLKNAKDADEDDDNIST